MRISCCSHHHWHIINDMPKLSHNVRLPAGDRLLSLLQSVVSGLFPSLVAKLQEEANAITKEKSKLVNYEHVNNDSSVAEDNDGVVSEGLAEGRHIWRKVYTPPDGATMGDPGIYHISKASANWARVQFRDHQHQMEEDEVMDDQGIRYWPPGPAIFADAELFAEDDSINLPKIRRSGAECRCSCPCCRCPVHSQERSCSGGVAAFQIPEIETEVIITSHRRRLPRTTPCTVLCCSRPPPRCSTDDDDDDDDDDEVVHVYNTRPLLTKSMVGFSDDSEGEEEDDEEAAAEEMKDFIVPDDYESPSQGRFRTIRAAPQNHLRLLPQLVRPICQRRDLFLKSLSDSGEETQGTNLFGAGFSGITPAPPAVVLHLTTAKTKTTTRQRL